jgi:hypothetical protein
MLGVGLSAVVAEGLGEGQCALTVGEGLPRCGTDLAEPGVTPDRPVVDLTHERIRRRPVLGGLITEYERTAWKPITTGCQSFETP